MGKESEPRILKDDDLGTATEEELRTHYSTIADRYTLLRPESQRVSEEQLVRDFAHFAGCKPSQVTFVPALESSSWSPLSDSELTSLTLPEDEWQEFLASAI